MDFFTTRFLDVRDPALLAVDADKLEGYVALAAWESDAKPGGLVDLFRVRFNVPDEPTDRGGQTVFFFPGAQPSRTLDYKAILQPVLQWGPSAAGGGASWSVISYYVRGTPETGLDIGVYSSERRVSPGDELTATITLHAHTVADRPVYRYSCEFEGLERTRLTIDLADPMVFFLIALEAYKTDGCGSLPKGRSTSFDVQAETEGSQQTPDWFVRTKQVCGVSTTIEDGAAPLSRVTIGWGAGQI